ncbi:hypothetical protein EJD97_016180, partial [Solanum chilense]
PFSTVHDKGVMYLLMILSHFTFLKHIQEQQINKSEIPGIEDVAISKESGTDETLVESIDGEHATHIAEISGEADVHMLDVNLVLLKSKDLIEISKSHCGIKTGRRLVRNKLSHDKLSWDNLSHHAY